MFKAYSKCREKGKCAFIGTATLVACLLGAGALWLFDDGKQRVTMIDGIHYDHNPWAKTD